MSDELENRHEKLLAEIDDWVCGRRSYINLGPHAPYTPDVIAAMDAQEVVKLVAALGAYPAVEATCPHGVSKVEACVNCMRAKLETFNRVFASLRARPQEPPTLSHDELQDAAQIAGERGCYFCALWFRKPFGTHTPPLPKHDFILAPSGPLSDPQWKISETATEGDGESLNYERNREPSYETLAANLVFRNAENQRLTRELEQLRGPLSDPERDFEIETLKENLESRGPLSDEPRENENQDGAAPVLGDDE